MDTIAAIATPPGAGALGILRMSGPAARGIAEGLLGLPPGALAPRRAFVGRASFEGRPIDRVVALFFPGPASATGEDVAELSAHGSAFILRRLLDAALARGARAAGPGEFTQRAFLNGKLDLAQAEAVCHLIRARTALAHRAALDQLEGGLSRGIRASSGRILDVLAALEASLDHPEEDLPRPEPGATADAIRRERSALAELAASFRAGRFLAEGARVCIVGRPNAGKSSLLNALLGTDRAIVCPAPGTTRDTLEEPCDLGGIPAVLIDTAGLRDEPEDEAEALGLERSLRALERSDLAILVVDGSRPEDREDEAVHRRVIEGAAALGRPALVVRAKADLPAAPQARAFDAAVSAATGSGLAALAAKAAGRLGDGPAPEGSAVVTSARHHAALAACLRELDGAAEAVEASPRAWEELAAARLRDALRALGEITGETPGSSAVLEAVFSKFCVGK